MVSSAMVTEVGTAQRRERPSSVPERAASAWGVPQPDRCRGRHDHRAGVRAGATWWDTVYRVPNPRSIKGAMLGFLPMLPGVPTVRGVERAATVDGPTGRFGLGALSIGRSAH